MMAQHYRYSLMPAVAYHCLMWYLLYSHMPKTMTRPLRNLFLTSTIRPL
jgi:hypothetical protein